MKSHKWICRNGLWIALMLAAPMSGALVSYLAVTWLDSSDVEQLAVAERAEAGQAVPTPRGRWTIEEAEAFREYPVFWAGEDLAGMPLRNIRRMQYYPPEGWARPEADMVNVSYGDCTPKPCVAPVTITSSPYCLARPEMAAEGLLGPRFNLRKASAHWVGRGETTLVLHAGGSTVTVTAPAGKATVLEVASRLTALNALGPVSPSEPLGPVTAVCLSEWP